MSQCLSIHVNNPNEPNAHYNIKDAMDTLLYNQPDETIFDWLLDDDEHIQELIQHSCNNDLTFQTPCTQNMYYTFINVLRFYQTMSEKDRRELKKALSENSRCPRDFYKWEELSPIPEKRCLNKDEAISVLQNNPEFTNIKLLTYYDDINMVQCVLLTNEKANNEALIRTIEDTYKPYESFSFARVTY